MGQQQLLLIVLGTIIVGVAVVVGINMFTTGAVNAERDALVQDVNNIASASAAYWRKPIALGGGGRTFVGVTDVTTFGAADSNANGTYAITGTAAIASFTVLATGGSEGVTVAATITPTGISGVLTIVIP